MDLLIRIKDEYFIINTDVISYWDQFKIDKYSEYLKKKMIFKLKNINCN